MASFPSLLDARYELLGPLGHGGMGSVFRAFDRETGRPVALKTVESAELGPWLADALRHEFRVLAGLRHPNLVEVYEFGVAGPGAAPGMAAWFTEELLEGTTLDVAVGQRPPAEWLPWIVQLCRALEFLHSRGYVHGDIKPNNVLVLSDGRVKLVDLGLATEIRARGGAGELRGTPAYLAPEIFRGESIDGRTDLYALGVTLYELVAGRHPFHAQTPREWMRRHCQTPAPPFLPGTPVPSFLEHLVFRLLEKDARARFFRANDVLEAVNRGLGTHLPAETDATLAGRIFSVHWVGRRDVLSGLERTVERLRTAAPGPADLLLLEGEPGMGKSRCLRELDHRTQVEGVMAVRLGFQGAGHAAESPLRRVCRWLAGRLPEERERRATWVRDYEPFLRALERPEAESGEGAEPERARACLARLVAAASVELPIALLLDDLDLGPEGALRDVQALLAAARSAEGGVRLLVCATTGGAGAAAPDPAGPVGRGLDALRRAPEARRSPLPALTREETAELSAGVLGLARVPEPFVAWLHAATAGVPFWIEETLRGLVAHGRVQVGESFEAWQPPPDAPGPEGAQDRLGAFLAGLVQRWSPDERAIAEVLAVLGRPAARPLVQAAAGLDVATLRAGTEGLVGRGLLRVESGEAGSGGVLGLTRGAMGPWLHARLSPEQRTTIHRRLGAAPEGGPAGLTRAERALHLALAGVGEPATGWWLDAAADARRAGNAAAAETILRHLLALDGRADRGEAVRPLATLLIHQARLDEADAVAVEAQAEAERRPGDAGEGLRALALELRASCRARRGDIGGARPIFLEAYALWDRRAAADEPGARAALDRLAPYVAAACAETGQLEEADRLIERHLTREPPAQARAQYHYLRGLRLRRAGEFERAEEEMRLGVEVARTIPDPIVREATVAAARYGLSGVLRERGVHADALDELQGALDAFHRLGQTISEISVLREMATLLLSIGRAQAALERARRGHRRAEQTGNPHALGSVLVHRGEVHEALGEWAEAEDDLVAAARVLEGAGSRMFAAEALLSLAELRNRAGRPAEAWTAAERAERLAEELKDTRLRARARLLQGWACRGLGVEERARERLAAALEERTPWTAGTADLLDAQAALERGDAGVAETKLESAKRALAGAGTALARLRLAALGVRVLLERGRVAEARRALDELRGAAGELELGVRGDVLELDARLLARAQRAYAAMEMWQDAARFWERRRAPLRLAAALAAAGEQALGLGDAAVARAYVDRAAALWAEETRKAPEWAREAFLARPDHARVREQARAPGARTERAAGGGGGVHPDDKTVVLELGPEPLAEASADGAEDAAARTPAAGASGADAEKDLLRAVILLLRERSPAELRRRLLEKSLETFGAARGILLLDAPRAGEGAPRAGVPADREAGVGAPRPAPPSPGGGGPAGGDGGAPRDDAAGERAGEPIRLAGAWLVTAETRGVDAADVGALTGHLAGLLRAPGTERKLSAGELVFLSPSGRRQEESPSRGQADGVVAPFLAPTGRLLGALYLDWSGAGAGAVRHAELLPLYVAHAAAALEAALEGERLATDAVTGLPSPACARRWMESALDRARRGGWSLGVIWAGLGGLDGVRETEGLAAADARLRAAAADLDTRVRARWTEAWTARESGDAFLAVVPGASAEDLGAFAAHLAADTGLRAGAAAFPADGPEPEALLWTARRRA